MRARREEAALGRLRLLLRLPLLLLLQGGEVGVGWGWEGREWRVADERMATQTAG